MKILLLWFSLIIAVFLSKTALCQDDTAITHFIVPPPIIKTFPVNGRVMGLNLEILQGTTITDRRTNEKTNTDSRGIYHLNAAKGDTLTFEFSQHSKEIRTIKRSNENMNVILIKRKVDELPANPSSSDLRKAKSADDELYRILEKDAKLEGKWNY